MNCRCCGRGFINLVNYKIIRDYVAVNYGGTIYYSCEGCYYSYYSKEPLYLTCLPKCSKGHGYENKECSFDCFSHKRN